MIKRLMQFHAAPFMTFAFAGLSVAQMPKPNPEAYDTPPVLVQQDATSSAHQEIVQSATSADQRDGSSTPVLLILNVAVNGLPSHVRVVHGVGMGLDEKAVLLTRQDRFKPATKDGTPVVATISTSRSRLIRLRTEAHESLAVSQASSVSFSE
jgi:hypothetical protein